MTMVVSKEMRNCPKCGHVMDSLRVCPQCGYKRRGRPPKPKPSKTPRPCALKIPKIPEMFEDNLRLIPDRAVAEVLGEDLAVLYGFEADGFDEWTISDIINLYQEIISRHRMKVKTRA